MNPARTRIAATALCIATVLSAQGSVEVRADELVTPVDTSKWKCRYCAFQSGFNGEVEIGIGDTSNSSPKFGEYNGLDSKGAYLIGNASARYRNDSADYLDLSVTDLGLDTRSLGIEGGRQGKYDLSLRYDEIPQQLPFGRTRTPYIGSGGDILTLPPGWVRGGSTAGMTQLATSLRRTDPETKRKRVDVSMALMPTSRWRYSLSYRHETKEGQRVTAGTFFFNAAQLIRPVNYVTDQVDASVSYTTRKWHTALAYYGSFFNNDNRSLTWENAYTSGFGADAGQLALAPDNQFNQFVLSGAYQVTNKMLASGEVAVGRMEQNESFLPYTLNNTLSVNALPANSLDGKVDTVNANLKLVSTVSQKLRLNASYTYNDRDNNTPQLTFDTWVSTDSFVNGPRTTLPYSFTQNLLKFSADYRYVASTRLGAGYDYDATDRTYQEVDGTRESTVWAKISTRAMDTDVTFKIAHGSRDVSSYTPVPEIQPSENPLLRKYNMADRERNVGTLYASIQPRKKITVGLSIDYANDDYTGSMIGLKGGSEFGVQADGVMVLTQNANFHVFLGQQEIRSSQAGSQAFSAPDWLADNNDTIATGGFGFARIVNDQLDVGVDYTLSRSTGRTTIGGVSPSVFPKNTADLDSLKLYANYKLKEAMSLSMAYWYEHYSSSSWAIDGVAPGTIPNVLDLGIQSPSYNVSLVALSFRYQY